jgi:outer membrane protein TolC
VKNHAVASRSGITLWGACLLGLQWLGHPVPASCQAEAAPAPQTPAPAPPTAPQPAPTGEPLTLDQSVQLALQNNRRVQNTTRQVSANQHELSAARTERLPQFGIAFLGKYGTTTSSGQVETLPPLGPIPTYVTEDAASGFFVARISQPVLDLKRIGLNVQLRETAVASSQQEVRLREQEVRSSVKQVYYDLVEIQSAMDANEESVKYYRELERTVADRVQQKTALQAELLEVQARRSAQEHEGVVLRDNYISAQERLNYLMGRDVRTSFRISTVGDVVPPPGDQTTLQNLALQQRPEVRQASLGVRTAQLNEKIARTQYIPSLSVGAQYYYFTGDLPTGHDDLSVGLLFTWEVFDWGRRREQIRAQGIAVQQQQTSLEDSRAQVIMDVNTQYRTLQSARDQLEVTKAVQTASRERVRLELDRYAQKAVLLSDALLAQSALAQANTRNQEALSAYLTAVANLSRAIGEN